LSGYERGQLEEVRKVQTVGTDFSELMGKYEMVLGDERYDFSNLNLQKLVLHSPNITEVLTPEEINSFLQATRDYEEHKDYLWKTDLMMSCLIQNSYHQGFNRFNFEIRNFSIPPSLGIYLVGEEKNPIDVTILGNAVLDVGYKANYSMFTVNGDVGGSGCGLYARFSSFTFNGRVNFASKLERFHCTFKTTFWDNIAQMKENIPPGNRIIYINGETEQLVRDYHE